MTYQVLRELRVKTGQGETVLSPGQLIRLDTSKANPLIESGKIKPIELKKTPINEHRRKTLLDCMTATWETISTPYFKTEYKLTKEIKKAESAIKKVQDEVLDGKAKLADFRNVCLEWETVVQEIINKPIN